MDNVISHRRGKLWFTLELRTQATVGGSPFGTFISVARGHSRE